MHALVTKTAIAIRIKKLTQSSLLVARAVHMAATKAFQSQPTSVPRGLQTVVATSAGRPFVSIQEAMQLVMRWFITAAPKAWPTRSDPRAGKLRSMASSNEDAMHSEIAVTGESGAVRLVRAVVGKCDGGCGCGRTHRQEV